MSALFKKLNLGGQGKILVMNAPQSFEPELSGLAGVEIVRDMKFAKEVSFSLIFAMRQTEVDKLAALIAARQHGDTIIWFAYPKGTSKNYSCDFNRDTGWEVMRQQGYDTVRQVAIDADWSALRFRRLEFIGKR
jgi:hypothetical protein